MTLPRIATKEELNKLRKYWQRSKGDKDKFKSLVSSDKNLTRGWNSYDILARRHNVYDHTSHSKKYPFKNLSQNELEELIGLLENKGANGALERFPQFTRKQLSHFISDRGLKIKKDQNQQKDEKPISKADFKKNINKYAEKILKLLHQHGALDPKVISDEAEISPQMVFRVIDELANRGYQVVKNSDGRFELSNAEVGVMASSEHHWRPNTRILVWAGAELGSIGQQADLLKTVYTTIVPEEKPDFIIALGNVIVGNLSKAKKNETFLDVESEYLGSNDDKKVSLTELNYRAQIDYVTHIVGPDAMTCVSSHKCNTYFISGLREQTFIKHGFEDSLEKLCNERLVQTGRKNQDWFYFGRNMHAFRVINTGKPICVLAMTSKKNPFRGAYTRGYRPRKTSSSIAGWLINTLRVKGVSEYPRIVLWSDGVGVFTTLGDSEATMFISLPKLAVTDPTELELDTPPNLGCVLVDLMFNEAGELKPNGIEWRFRNLAPYIRERGF